MACKCLLQNAIKLPLLLNDSNSFLDMKKNIKAVNKNYTTNYYKLRGITIIINETVLDYFISTQKNMQRNCKKKLYYLPIDPNWRQRVIKETPE